MQKLLTFKQVKNLQTEHKHKIDKIVNKGVVNFTMRYTLI